MGGEITFGPKETENTIVYQHLKKHHDQQYIKAVSYTHLTLPTNREV